MTTIKKKLSPQMLNAAQPKDKPYKLSDAAEVPGLYCVVSKKGTKTFCLSFNYEGNRCEITLGQYPVPLSLAKARSKAEDLRDQVKKGIDPRAEKQAEKAAKRAASLPPPPESEFRTFTEKWQKEKLKDRAESYKSQIQSRLDRFIFPVIGTKALKDVTTEDILKIIDPLLVDKANTAEGVRRVIQAIFAYAYMRGTVNDNPAARLKGIVEVPESEPSQKLTPKELGEFWRTVDKQVGAYPSTIAAAKFLVYTMTRKNETLKAKWSEVDLDKGTWLVPKERMKMKKPHLVFLSRQAKALLKEHKKTTGDSEYLFPSPFRNNLPLSSVALNHFFKRMDVPHAFSPHGTRSTCASLLRELKVIVVDPDGVRREKRVEYEVVEKLLAHSMEGVAGRYQRQEMYEERAEASQLLADEIDRLVAASEQSKMVKARSVKATTRQRAMHV